MTRDDSRESNPGKGIGNHDHEPREMKATVQREPLKNQGDKLEDRDERRDKLEHD